MKFKKISIHPVRFILISIITISFLVFISGCGEKGPDPIIQPPPPAPEQQKIKTSLTSEFVSESYPLNIYLPAAYESNKNLSVLYLLDGTLLFDHILLARADVGLDVIIVGIGDHAANGEQIKRQRDYKQKGCGATATNDGFLNFYKFVTEEVVPYIDENYENDHAARSLLGYSMAGSFTTVAMFMEDPENVMFHGFIAIDPGIGCRADFFDEMHDNFSKVPENIKFHYSQSNENDIIWLNEFIEGKSYPFLDNDYKVYENEDHESVFAP